MDAITSNILTGSSLSEIKASNSSKPFAAFCLGDFFTTISELSIVAYSLFGNDRSTSKVGVKTGSLIKYFQAKNF